MPVNRKEQSRASVDSILDAGFNVIARHSLSGTTTAKIAAEAGVSKPLLHYHFKDGKDSILTAILERRVLERLLEIPLGDLKEKMAAQEEIKGIFRRYKDTINDDPDLLVVFYDFWVMGASRPDVREMIAKRFEGFRGYVGQIVSDGVASGEFMPEKSHMIPPLLISFLEGASLQLISDPKAFNYDLYQFMAMDMIALLAGKPV